MNDDDKTPSPITPPQLLKASALALAGAGLYGAAPLLRPVEAQPRLGAGGAEEAAGDRPDDGRLAASTPPRGGEERLGAMMAIKEFNDKGGVLGRRIEAIHMDTETTPATGSRVAERMITRNEAAFLIGAVHSGVANAISQVAQKYGCIFLNTNSSSPTEAGKDCHRVKFVWDGNGTNFSHAIVKNAMQVSGKNWVLLTNDYVWGHNTSKATRAIVEANGGKIVDELLVPQNTRDFSSYLLKLQQLKPDVVATAVGGDDIKALRQQVVQLEAEQEHGLDQQPAGLARRLRPRAGRDLRRVRHHLVLPARPAGREGVRRRLPEAVPGHGDPRAGQRLPQRLHGDARAAALRRGGRHDQQPRGDQEARGPQDDGARPPAALRRLDEPGDAPVPADDLHGELQRRAGREGRHLQDPRPGRRRRTWRTRTRPSACKLETLRRRRRATSSERDARARRPATASMLQLLPHLRQRHLARAAVRADRARLHADRRRDGDDQPGARLAVRARHVRGAVHRGAAARLVSRAAGGVPGAADRHALRDRAVARAAARRPVRHAARAVPAPHLRRAIRCTACCSPSARRW